MERINRFNKKINKRSGVYGIDGKFSTECWEWTGAIGKWGYGNFHDGKKYCRAHRYSYEHYISSIPIGLDLDHLCRNRKCVNPEHLEPVTRQINLLRGKTIIAKQAAQKECIYGHDFTKENTYIDKRNRRHCKKCRVIRQRKYRQHLK